MSNTSSKKFMNVIMNDEFQEYMKCIEAKKAQGKKPIRKEASEGGEKKTQNPNLLEKLQKKKSLPHHHFPTCEKKNFFFYI